MAKKRNTKIALASLMAVSAIAPVVASADTNGSVTTEAGTSRSTEAQVTKTINFTVEGETGMLANYVKGPSQKKSVLGSDLLSTSRQDLSS